MKTMKLRTLCLIVLSSLIPTAGLQAETIFLPEFKPVTPVVQAQGGSYTAVAEGYNALFTNPAGFSLEGSDLTFNFQQNTFLPLSSMSNLIQLAQSGALYHIMPSDPASGPTIDYLNSLLTENGLGLDFRLGMGYTGYGFGIGFLMTNDIYARGQTILGTMADTDFSLTTILGYSLPVDLGGAILRIGGDIRPIFKSYAAIPVIDLLNNIASLMMMNRKVGLGFAFDFGMLVDFGEFRGGLSLRDIAGTRFQFADIGFAQYLSLLSGTNTLNQDPNTYVIPMVISLGMAYKPVLGNNSEVIEPRFHFQFDIPVKDVYTQPSLWTGLHLGAEARLLKFLNIRTGLNQGYFTFGLGAKLAFVDFNMSLFSQELGRYLGETKRSGLSTEVALRF